MDASHFPRRRGTVDHPKIRFVGVRINPVTARPLYRSCPTVPLCAATRTCIILVSLNHQCKCCKFHAPKSLQPTDHLPNQSHQCWLPLRRPTPQCQVHPKISYAKPCNIKRPHETAMQRPAKHDTQTTPSLPSTPTLCPKHPSTCHAGPNS